MYVCNHILNRLLSSLFHTVEPKLAAPLSLLLCLLFSIHQFVCHVLNKDVFIVNGLLAANNPVTAGYFEKRRIKTNAIFKWKDILCKHSAWLLCFESRLNMASLVECGFKLIKHYWLPPEHLRRDAFLTLDPCLLKIESWERRLCEKERERERSITAWLLPCIKDFSQDVLQYVLEWCLCVCSHVPSNSHIWWYLDRVPTAWVMTCCHLWAPPRIPLLISPLHVQSYNLISCPPTLLLKLIINIPPDTHHILMRDFHATIPSES